MALGGRVFVEASVLNVPATEFTVMFDHRLQPPDPYLDPRAETAAIIIVQNVYPFEEQPTLNGHVAVRVVDNAARVIAGPLLPYAERLLAAAGPMPIPVQGPPGVGSLPPVESYGYRQALG